MCEARRPLGRLFYLLVMVTMALAGARAQAPATTTVSEVHYRGSGRAMTRITDAASVTAQNHGTDNGVRGTLRHVKSPPARTAEDCENAALAILDDATGAAWEGEYDTWSDFLPGAAQDIFPGDAVQVNMPTRGAAFQATVREVDITMKDLAGEHGRYKIKFANDAAKPLGFEFDATVIKNLVEVTATPNTQVGSVFLSDLTAAAITDVGSTTVSVDAGVAPGAGGGIEVRWSDTGWGATNSRNLVGRFATQTFILPRLSKVQTVYLRQYDASTPPKYSRYTAALHVDYPL